MAEQREGIADILRGRLLRGLHAGSIQRGERLPSARAMREEFGVDHRIILDAYRILEREGLIELRARGGIYVSENLALGPVPLPSQSWIVDLLTQSVAREIPLVELHEWLRRAVETRRIRVVAIQSTEDAIEGIVRELRDDYGVDATGMDVSALANAEQPPREVTIADLMVTTTGLEDRVRPLADQLCKPLIIADIRSDLIGGEWRLLLRRPVYVVVRDSEFVPLLERYFANVPGRENIRPVVLGRDSLDVIPEGAPVYVTRSARGAIGGLSLRGRLLPTARLFSTRTSREIVDFIVRTNLRALAISPR